MSSVLNEIIAMKNDDEITKEKANNSMTNLIGRL